MKREYSSCEAAETASLCVELEVVMGKIRLSIEELLDLKAGQSFPFPYEPAAPCVLRLAGYEVGKGEILSDGSELWLHIVSLAESNELEKGSISRGEPQLEDYAYGRTEQHIAE